MNPEKRTQVLVVDDRPLERDRVARALRSVQVSVAESHVAGAVQSVGVSRPVAVLLAGEAALTPEVLRSLRAADASGTLYVIALLDGHAGKPTIPEILAAGAHDFVRSPFELDDLRARVLPSLRLHSWMVSLGRRGGLDWAQPVVIEDLPAWRYLGEVVCIALDQMLGRTLKIEPGWPASFIGPVTAATIPMSLPSSKSQARVSVFADDAALLWLGGVLLGDPNASKEMRLDVLREMTNTAGSALKRAALPDHATLTTGLPFMDTVKRSDDPGVQSWTVSIPGEVTLGVEGRIVRLRHVTVAATSVREGMMVVSDLRSESGTLLLAAGTRLTLTSAHRLRELLAPHATVEIAEAA